MMMENSQKKQSKEWFANALEELLAEKSFPEITIKELSNKADLDRRTFYRHFDTKEDVVKYRIDCLSKEYLSRLSRYDTLTLYDSLYELFSLCNENLIFLQRLNNNNLLFLLLIEFNRILPQLHSKIETKFSTEFSSTDEDVNFVLFFNAGGAWNVLYQWINEGKQLPCQKVARKITELISKN